jgi:hypothetical protein
VTASSSAAGSAAAAGKTITAELSRSGVCGKGSNIYP